MVLEDFEYSLCWCSSASHDCHLLFSALHLYRDDDNDNLGIDDVANNNVHQTRYTCLYCYIDEYLRLQDALLNGFQLYDSLVYLEK